MSDNDSYASSNEDACRHPSRPIFSDRPAKKVRQEPRSDNLQKTRKVRTTQPFIDQLKSKLDIVATPAGRKNARPASKCSHCSKILENVFRKWSTHARGCVGLQHAQEATVMAASMGYGGERHRLALNDSYIIAYDIYKNKRPFTEGAKLHEVKTKLLSPLGFLHAIINSLSLHPSC